MVVALTVIRLVKKNRVALLDADVADLSDGLPPTEVKMGLRLPKRTLKCPSKLAVHGPNHVVTRVTRCLGTIWFTVRSKKAVS